jgi:hypothetical protein
MEIIKDQLSGEDIVIITNDDGTTLSMLKTEYDRRQAEQSTPSLTDETSTK